MTIDSGSRGSYIYLCEGCETETQFNEYPDYWFVCEKCGYKEKIESVSEINSLLELTENGWQEIEFNDEEYVTENTNFLEYFMIFISAVITFIIGYYFLLR